MIFDESYDKALWLILHSDEKNRDEIIYFVNSLTAEMYECIRSFIRDYYNNRNPLISHRQIVDNNFSLRVEIHDDELTIKGQRWDIDKNYFMEEKFELSLMPLCEEQLHSMRYLDRTHVGKFSYNMSFKRDISDSTYNEHKNAGYVLKKRLGGYHLEVINPCLGYYLDSKKTNIKNIPNKMYPHQLKNEKRINRLIRARRRV